MLSTEMHGLRLSRIVFRTANTAATIHSLDLVNGKLQAKHILRNQHFGTDIPPYNEWDWEVFQITLCALDIPERGLIKDLERP